MASSIINYFLSSWGGSQSFGGNHHAKKEAELTSQVGPRALESSTAKGNTLSSSITWKWIKGASVLSLFFSNYAEAIQFSVGNTSDIANDNSGGQFSPKGVQLNPNLGVIGFVSQAYSGFKPIGRLINSTSFLSDEFPFFQHGSNEKQFHEVCKFGDYSFIAIALDGFTGPGNFIAQKHSVIGTNVTFVGGPFVPASTQGIGPDFSCVEFPECVLDFAWTTNVNGITKAVHKKLLHNGTHFDVSQPEELLDPSDNGRTTRPKAVVKLTDPKRILYYWNTETPNWRLMGRVEDGNETVVRDTFEIMGLFTYGAFAALNGDIVKISARGAGDGSDIKTRLMNITNGLFLAQDLISNANTTGEQSSPAVCEAPFDGFAEFWRSDSDSGGLETNIIGKFIHLNDSTILNESLFSDSSQNYKSSTFCIPFYQSVFLGWWTQIQGIGQDLEGRWISFEEYQNYSLPEESPPCSYPILSPGSYGGDSPSGSGTPMTTTSTVIPLNGETDSHLLTVVLSSISVACFSLAGVLLYFGHRFKLSIDEQEDEDNVVQVTNLHNIREEVSENSVLQDSNTSYSSKSKSSSVKQKKKNKYDSIPIPSKTGQNSSQGSSQAASKGNGIYVDPPRKKAPYDNLPQPINKNGKNSHYEGVGTKLSEEKTDEELVKPQFNAEGYTDFGEQVKMLLGGNGSKPSSGEDYEGVEGALDEAAPVESPRSRRKSRSHRKSNRLSRKSVKAKIAPSDGTLPDMSIDGMSDGALPVNNIITASGTATAELVRKQDNE